MNGRNSIVKNAKKFSERNAKISPVNSLPYRGIVKTEKISLSYNVNDYVYSKWKSILHRMDFVNLKVRFMQILASTLD